MTEQLIVPGHVLVCPIRHVDKIEDLTSKELEAIFSLIIKIKKTLTKLYKAEGFNFAWNEGQKAGQTVPHVHFHIVPRKNGDAGIYEYEPRKFLYRPGSREKTPQNELLTFTAEIKRALLLWKN